MPQASNRNRQKLYVIQRIDWVFNDERMVPGKINLLKAFRSKDQAEACWEQLEAQARADPVQHLDYILQFLFPSGCLAAITFLQEDEMMIHLERFGLRPPPYLSYRYRWEFYGWWESIRNGLDPATLHQFLEVFDRQEYYQVVETEMEV